MELKPPNRAVVLGVNGQDGSLLAEQLITRGDMVLGIGRQAASRYLPAQQRFTYAGIDLRDAQRLANTLEDFVPTQVYHVAAVHGAAGYPYEAVWSDALDVNLRAAHVVLEYARIHNLNLRVAYASSAKVFGTPLVGDISLKTPRRSDCLYSITKNSAEDLLAYYRQEHGIFGAVAYLFNHESERRSVQYFIPMLVDILDQSLRSKSYRKSVHTLDFYCDWGSAREYMSWFQDLLDLDTPRKLIFASGKVRYGRDFVAQLFSRYGLNRENHVIEDTRCHDCEPFNVSIDDTTAALDRVPKVDIFTVCNEILAAKQEMSGFTPAKVR